MSRELGQAFRHPTAEELLKLMDNARSERSIAIAGFLSLGHRQPKMPDRSATAPKPRAACAAAA